MRGVGDAWYRWVIALDRCPVRSAIHVSGHGLHRRLGRRVYAMVGEKVADDARRDVDDTASVTRPPRSLAHAVESPNVLSFLSLTCGHPHGIRQRPANADGVDPCHNPRSPTRDGRTENLVKRAARTYARLNSSCLRDAWITRPSARSCGPTAAQSAQRSAAAQWPRHPHRSVHNVVDLPLRAADRDLPPESPQRRRRGKAQASKVRRVDLRVAAELSEHGVDERRA